MQNQNQKRKREHIALDFDGTLSHYEGWVGPCKYGLPIPFMVAKIKQHLELGDKFTIFTARADRVEEVRGITEWLKAYGLPAFNITNIKSPQFTQFWDDRAVHIEKNTGMTEAESGWYSMHPEELEDFYKNYSPDFSAVAGVSK